MTGTVADERIICTVSGCEASALGGSAGRCLGHLNRDELSGALVAARSDGFLDAQGVRLSAGRLAEVLALFEDGDEVRVPAIDLTGATFVDRAAFAAVVFGGPAIFEKSVFMDGADFAGATFTDGAYFAGSKFERTFAEDGSARRAETDADTSFDGATFAGEADFGQRVEDQAFTFFHGLVLFSSARFEGGALFDETFFHGAVSFRDATFDVAALFTATRFLGARTTFAGASFVGAANFAGATFRRHEVERPDSWNALEAEAERRVALNNFLFGRNVRVSVEGIAYFRGAQFKEDASFAGAVVEVEADFSNTTFGEDVSLNRATFERSASFVSAAFERARKIGPLLVFDALVLDSASFRAAVDVEAAADRITCARTRFAEGANLRARWAEVALEEVDFGGPSLLVRAAPLPPPDVFAHRFDEDRLGGRIRGKADILPSEHVRTSRPRLISLRRANVGTLLISDTDLRACRFAKAHVLDGLRLEADAEFASTPGGVWSHRRALAEEHQWRASAKGGKREGWYGGECCVPDWLVRAHPEIQEPLDSDHIATIYRALRKGREDSKDEPGAADFYYGEMEMRRAKDHPIASAEGADESDPAVADDPETQASVRTTPAAERAILTLYWLVSGYALRASRVVAALAVVVLACAALLFWFGFVEGKRPDFAGSVLFSVQSATSLLRGPESDSLTGAGEVVWILLRLIGPVLFALFLLSLRGRVKR